MTKNDSPTVEDASDGEVSLGDMDLNPPDVPTTPRGNPPVAMRNTVSEEDFGEEPSEISQLGMAVRDESGGKSDVMAKACRVDSKFHHMFCGGLVNGASGDKICMKDGPDGTNPCTVKKHHRKASVETDQWLIVFNATRIGPCALSHPVLKDDMLPVLFDRKELSEKEFPIDVLIQFFEDHIDAAVSGRLDSIEAGRLKEVENKYVETKTPMKMEARLKPKVAFASDSSVRKRLELEEGEDESISRKLDILPTLVGNVENGAVKDLFEVLVDVMRDAGQVVINTRKDLSKVNTELRITCDNVAAVYDFAKSCDRRMGTCPAERSDLQNASVWGTILQLDNQQCETCEMNNRITEDLAEVKVKIDKTKEKLNSVVKSIKVTIPNLQSRMSFQESNHGGGESPRELPSSLAKEIKDIKHMALTMQSFGQHLDERINDVCMELKCQDAVSSRVADLESQVVSLARLSSGSGSYYFGEYVFSSSEDVKRILGDDLEGASLADFVEIFGMLCLSADQFTDGKTYADKSRSSSVIKSNNSEVDYMATLSHPTPGVLFTKTPNQTNVTDPEEGFGCNLKTFHDFSGKTAAFRPSISRKVNSLWTKIRGSVKAQGLAGELARHLGNETRTQLADMLALISDWHDELVSQCDYKTEVAWKFIGFAVRSIMDHLVPPRMEAAGVENLASAESKSKVIWAVLQVHIRMNSLVEAKFKSHPVITTAMSNFIMKSRVDKSHVDSMGTKVTEAVKASSTIEKKIASLETELKSLKQTLGNKIAALDKKK